jgi:hypothetical protein
LLSGGAIQNNAGAIAKNKRAELKVNRAVSIYNNAYKLNRCVVCH